MYQFFTPLLAAIFLSACANSNLLVHVYGPKLNKHDVLECGLNSGDKFVLEVKYQASLLQREMGTYGTTATPTQRYSVVFISTKEQIASPVAPSKVYIYSYTNKGLIYSCSDVGVVNQIPIVDRSYLKADGTWFDKSLIPQKLKLSTWDEPFKVRDLLHELALNKRRNAYILPIENRLIFEAALTRNNIVKMVYQSVSDDGGVTWSDPVVTKDAKIYELDKSYYQQSFSPRPISFNGEKVNTDSSFEAKENQNQQNQGVSQLDL